MSAAKTLTQTRTRALGAGYPPPRAERALESRGIGSRLCVFAVLQLLLLRPGVVKPDTEPPSLKSLISDPYILIAAGEQTGLEPRAGTAHCCACTEHPVLT